MDQRFKDRQTGQTSYQLRVGGKSSEEYIVQVGASITAFQPDFVNIEPEWPVPSTEVAMGDFGNLDDSGNAYKKLSGGAVRDISPSVSGVDYYSLNGPPGKQKYSLTHVCVADTPTNKNRLAIGVCEEVDLGGMPGNTTWSAPPGTLSTNKGAAVRFTAPDTEAGSVTIKATVANAEPATLEFRVVKPSGAILLNYPGTLSKIQSPYLSVACWALWYIPPDNVSFYNVKIVEGAAQAVTTGYYDQISGQLHPLGSPQQGSLVVRGLGTWCSGLDYHDTISAGAAPPYTNGTFVWHIPWSYITPRGTTNYFTTVDHSGSLTASATNAATLVLKKDRAGGSVSSP
jgi:hypothetical protein